MFPYGHGFKRILVVNGLGGNSPVRNHLHEVNNTLPDLRLNWYDWWLSPSVEAVATKHNLKPSHANWLEAFPFTIVSDLPEGSKSWPRVPGAIMDSKTARRVYEDGSFGGEYRASEDVMQRAICSLFAGYRATVGVRLAYLPRN